jgi:hypothetical protein
LARPTGSMRSSVMAVNLGVSRTNEEISRTNDMRAGCSAASSPTRKTLNRRSPHRTPTDMTQRPAPTSAARSEPLTAEGHTLRRCTRRRCRPQVEWQRLVHRPDLALELRDLVCAQCLRRCRDVPRRERRRRCPRLRAHAPGAPSPPQACRLHRPSRSGNLLRDGAAVAHDLPLWIALIASGGSVSCREWASSVWAHGADASSGRGAAGRA